MTTWVLYRGRGHRVNTCVRVRAEWVAQFRARVAREGGRVIAVYRSNGLTLPRETSYMAR